MKNKILLALGIVVVLVLVSLAGCSATGLTAAEGQPINVNVGNQQTGIWVNGTGKVTVTPDVATLTLGVSVQSATVAEAQSQAAISMDKVMTSLKENGVAEKDIQTQYYNIQQVTRWDETKSEEIVIGYRVSNTVTAKIRDMEKVGTVIDAVALAGGDYTRINGIGFSVENPEKYYTDVRKLAMDDAKAKAQQIAELSGVTLGKPTYVLDNNYSSPVIYRQAAFAYDEAAGAAPKTAISGGEMDITLNVQVAYAIE